MLLYGNDSQYVFATPQCAGYVGQPGWHYFLLVCFPIISAFATLVNGWIASLLLFDADGRHLLQQPQHVYVLGCAITNVGVASGCNFILWISAFLVPCIDLGVVPCFIKNLFNFAGCYQVLFNVCLICYDRWRMVRLGANYNHALEVRRAKWLLCATSALSAILFVVPEFGVPALTGDWLTNERDTSASRCKPTQDQPVPEFGGLIVADMIAGMLVFVQWAIIVIFTTSTAWILYRKTAWKRNSPKIQPFSRLPTAVTNTFGKGVQNSSMTTQISSAASKQVRATLIMFGIVVATLVTNGPLAVLLAWLQINPNIVSGWYPVQTLIILQLTTPAIDPFVFALTLPKLRVRARKNRGGRALLWLLTLNRNKNSDTTVYMVDAGNKSPTNLASVAPSRVVNKDVEN